MRFGGTKRRLRKRGMHISKREKRQLVILGLAIIVVVLMAMALGMKTRH
jgi:cell division protein FtsL